MPRKPSYRKSVAARKSTKRYIRHNLGFKAPRGWGWITNPKRAAYNRAYYRKQKLEGMLIMFAIQIVFYLVAFAASTLWHLGKFIYFLILRILNKPPLISPTEKNRDNAERFTYFKIKYRDVNETVTERNIQIQRIKKDDSYLLILAYCELRESLRSFRSDRILECVDLASGEAVADIATYLKQVEKKQDIA